MSPNEGLRGRMAAGHACQADPMLRRDQGRSVQEAEELALKTLETLLKTPTLGYGAKKAFLRP